TFPQARDLGGQPPTDPLAVVHLDRARDAIAVLPHPLKAPLHDPEHVVPLTFQDRAHRVEPVVHPALIHDRQRPGHVLADAFAFAERRHAELQEHHRSHSFLWFEFHLLYHVSLPLAGPHHPTSLGGRALSLSLPPCGGGC